ncbi:phosphotransferase [Thalassotalea agarivorans]|uniref:Thiamine kinase n=1 Tax=Thalassotalea agarivorans TaxID=349064 RepID=A0A1I0EQ54_THASX|nr:phosphotransferase [Thalassotalea agarivorans]SET47349.1 Thiamine kinase [Thalassotalea agarivorans]
MTDMLAHSLIRLPCFAGQQVCIAKINQESNNTCFTVTLQGHKQPSYIAKFGSESIAFKAIYRLFENVTSSVVYHDSHWLVVEFIEGVQLATAHLSIQEKLTLVGQLASTIHRSKISEHLMPVSAVDIANSLLIAVNPIEREYKLIKHILDAQRISDSDQGLANCHGDLNFNNVILDKFGQAKAIDFEFACLAPIEYELAMCLTVNGCISRNAIESILKGYAAPIDTDLLEAYLPICAVINYLWYLQFQKSDKNYKQQIKSQWHLIERLIV